MLSPNCLIFLRVENGEQYNESDAHDFGCHQRGRNGRSKRIQVDAQGEMLEVKITVSTIVNQLSTLADEVTRVSLQVGTEGILGGQATVTHVQGIWKVCKVNLALPRK